MALLAVMSGTIILRSILEGHDTQGVVATLPLNAVEAAADDQAGQVVVAGGDTAWGSHGTVSMLDAGSDALLRAAPVRGLIARSIEFGPTSLLALAPAIRRSYVSSTVAGNGVIAGGFVSVVDSGAGTVVRAIASAPQTLPLALAVDRRARRLFVVDGANPTLTLDGNKGRVVVLDARSGRPVAEALVDRGPTAIAVDERLGRAFVASRSVDKNGVQHGPSRLSVLDSSNGRVLHIIAIPPAMAGGMAVDATTDRVFALVDSIPVQDPYIGRVATIDARTGRVIGMATVGSLPRDMIVATVPTGRRGATAERVFVLNAGYPPTNGGVSVLDGRTGALVRADLFPGATGATAMAVDPRNGRVFVATGHRDGKGNNVAPGGVVMLDGYSGRALRTVTIGANPSALAVDERRGRVFVAVVGDSDFGRPYDPPKGPGSVTVLDAHNDSVLRTMTVGVNPFELVVAAPAGRVFVLDGGDTISGRAADGWAWLPSWLRQRVPFLPPPPGNTDRVVPPDVEVLDATR